MNKIPQGRVRLSEAPARGVTRLRALRRGLTRTPAERLAILHFPTPEAAEWFSIRCGAWWCLLLTPTVHLFPANPLFAGLARVAPEPTWLAVIGGMIAAQLLALLWGNAALRAGLLFLAGILWAGVAGLTWGAAPHCALWPCPHTTWLAKTTGIGAYGTLAADCLSASIHLVKRLYIDWLVRVDRSAGGPLKF